MSDRIEFLQALFTVEAITFYDHDEGVFIARGTDVRKQVSEPGDLLVNPLTEDGKVAFVWKHYKSAVNFETPPTALMRKGEALLACWALENPVEPNDGIVALNDQFDADIPLPDTEGWALVSADPDLYYAPEDIRVHASPLKVRQAALEPVVEDDDPPFDLPLYDDARMLTPYDESDPKYAEEIVISLGARRDSNDWKPTRMPRGALIAMLCRHKEGKKDGPAFVSGDMVPGRRLKTAIKSLWAVGIDIDTGKPTSEIDRAIKKLGVTAVRYSTHSHRATTTTFPRDTVLKKTGASDIDDEVVRKFLTEIQEWDERIVKTATFAGTEHEERGIVVVVEHAPMDKSRVVVPLAECFDIAKEGATQRDAMAKWAKIPRALAKELKVPLDESCLDPSRLFYFPRHDKDRAFDTALFGGPLFDWRQLTLDDPLEDELKRLGGETKTGPNTQAGKKLGKWAVNKAVGFQIADAIQDYAADRVRYEKAQGQLEVECPFDDNHSNAGDPEDRGFFVCNAGDGDGETFHASCRHASCQGLRNIDFLGKMIDDGWLPESVLQDANYNIALEESETTEEQSPEELPETDDPMVLELRKDKVFANVRGKIEALRKESGPEERMEAIKAVYKDEKIGGVHRQWCLDVIKTRLKVNQVTMGRLVKFARASLREDAEKRSKTEETSDKFIYEYEGDYHFDEATRVCQLELKRANLNAAKRYDKPLFTCLQDRVVKMRKRPDGRLAFDDLTRDGMWADLNKRMAFVQNTDSMTGKRQKVPEDVAKQVYEEAYDFLPQTPEVTYTPSFAADGKLLINPGWTYEDNGRVNILLHDSGFKLQSPIPEEPTVEDVEEAVRWLRDEVLGDFPFLDFDSNDVERREPSEANALAMLITPFMRRMIDGCTPVFFVTKPLAGTGGTMLGKLPLILYDGEEGMPMAYTQSEDEMKKYLVAAVMDTRSHLFFDDVVDFNNRVLLQALTSRYVGGRLLGSSKTVERPNLFGWVATGNNPIIGNEMDRRICWIRLNAKVGNIQGRKFKERYKIENGREVNITYARWLVETREKTVYSILTLIQNWIAHGMPNFEQRSLVSFEDWAKKVGGVLQLACIEGFLDNRRTVNIDQNEASIRDFVRRWHADKNHSISPVSAKTLFEWSVEQALDILEGNNDDVKKHRFFRRLKTLEGRVFELGGKTYMVRETLDDEFSPVWELQLEDDAPREEAA